MKYPRGKQENSGRGGEGGEAPSPFIQEGSG